jgi:hypothetical protein
MNRVDETRQKKWIQEEASRLGAGRPGGAGEVKQRRLPGGGGSGGADGINRWRCALQF